ncbi:MAG: hypothetical protein ACK4M3_01435 [Pyrobaculum sp.]
MSLDVAYLALGELEKLLTQHDQKTRAIEDTWQAFINAALEAKSAWDRDLPKVRIRIEQLRNVIEGLRRELEMLYAKKELGLIPEGDYISLTAELEKKIAEYQDRLNSFVQKAAELESRVLYLWARALTREYLAKFDLVELEKRVEEAKASGAIDDETYAKIKHEITLMKNTWELLNLLY